MCPPIPLPFWEWAPFSLKVQSIITINTHLLREFSFGRVCFCLLEYQWMGFLLLAQMQEQGLDLSPAWDEQTSWITWNRKANKWETNKVSPWENVQAIEQEGELRWSSAGPLGLGDGSGSPAARVGRVEDSEESSKRKNSGISTGGPPGVFHRPLISTVSSWGD